MPSVTGLKGGIVVAVVGGPTVLDGVVTTLGGVLVAAVVEVVLAALAGRVELAFGCGVVAAVAVVLAAATDEADADLPLFELVEQPDAPSARTIATRSDHLRAEDLISLPPIFSARC